MSWKALPSQDTFHAWPGLKKLRCREFDVLQGKGCDTFPTDKYLTFDVSQNHKRVAGREGVLLCVTCKARLFHGQKCRMVLGLEALRAQCVFLNKEDEAALVKAFSNDSIHYCAGNAFNSYCIDHLCSSKMR